MLYTEQRQQWIKTRRTRRKLARQARIRRQIFRYFLLCLLLYLGISGLIYLPWRLSNRERDIKVCGNNIVTALQVRNAIDEAMKLPIYAMQPVKLEHQVEQLKMVKHAFVRRYAFPHPKLIVAVMEEFPWAMLSASPDAESKTVISQSGRTIPLKEFPALPKPLLQIFAQENLKLSQTEVSQWASWIGYVEDLTGEPVKFVDMRKPLDVRLQVGNLYLKLGMADATMTKRIGRLASILTSIEAWRDRIEYIDLGLDNNVPLKLAKHSDKMKLPAPALAPILSQ